jgi:photosystem II stability/assembly factor-like uncharacterized protein
MSSLTAINPEIATKPLPSNQPTAATAAIGRRILSADTAGTLYLSKNAGKRWKRVKPVWQGKAVHLAIGQPQIFELTTETGALWQSTDGKHWHVKPFP